MNITNSIGIGLASKIKKIIAKDSFNRENGLVGNTENGQVWQQNQYTTGDGNFGSYEIKNNQLSLTTSSMSSLNRDLIYLDLGVFDNLALNVTFINAVNNSRVFFRTDRDSRYSFFISTNGTTSYRLFRQSTMIGENSNIKPAPGDKVRIELKGSNIKIFINNVEAFNVNDSYHYEAVYSCYGLGGYQQNGILFDDFIVEEL